MYNSLALITAGSLLFSTVTVPNIQPVNNVGYIFLGDSRTVGMQQGVKDRIKSNTYFVAECGQGYNWLVSEGLERIEEIMEENSQISDWNIVTNLGVNDLSNVNKYREIYDELKENEWKDVNLYYESVNPVNEKLCKTVTNEQINEFNTEFASESSYIDVNSRILPEHIKGDGLHYSSSIYCSIYDYVNGQLISMQNKVEEKIPEAACKMYDPEYKKKDNISESKIGRSTIINES